MSVTCLDTKNVLILVNFIEMNCLCFVEIQDVVTLILSESSMKEVACCFCKWWSDVWMFLQRQVSSYSHKTDEKWWKKADILSWESSTQRYKWCRIKVKLSFFSLTSRLKTPSRGCRASRTSTSWNSGTVCCFLYCLSTLSLKMFGDRKLNTSESVHFGWTWCMLWCSVCFQAAEGPGEVSFTNLSPVWERFGSGAFCTWFCFTDDTLVLWFRWFACFRFSSLCFSLTFKACFSPDLAEFIQRALKPSDQSDPATRNFTAESPSSL